MVYFTIINLESLFVCDLNIFYIPRTVNMLKKLSEASKVSTSELYLPDLSTRIFSTSFRPAVNICFIQINNKNMLKTIILPYSYFILRKKCQKFLDLIQPKIQCAQTVFCQDIPVKGDYKTFCKPKIHRFFLKNFKYTLHNQ